MNISCKVCQSEEAVNPQSKYPICETCAVEFLSPRQDGSMVEAAQEVGGVNAPIDEGIPF